MIGAKNVDVRIELEDDRSIWIVLDRRTDCILVPWQDAYDLADVLAMVVKEAKNLADFIDIPALVREQNQVRLNGFKGCVAVLFEYTDRVRLTWPSAKMVADALKIKAQDVQFWERGIRLTCGVQMGFQKNKTPKLVEYARRKFRV